MALSNDLISQFVKYTKDESKQSKESVVYGTAKVVTDESGKVVSTQVQLDGSSVYTPVTSTTEVKDGERVTVLIKDHSAVITGNMSSPAARVDTVNAVSKVEAHRVTAEELIAVEAYIEKLRVLVAGFDKLTADELKAVNAKIESIEAKIASVDNLTVEDANIIDAEIESLQAYMASIKNLDVEDLNAANAEIDNLRVYLGAFTYLTANVFEALRANIRDLSVKKFDAKQADIKYANIDFANIGEAAIRKIFADSGLIYDLKVGDHTVTGELVGVTISGDLIKAKTLVAEKLVVRGSDGKLYKLNQDFSKLDGVTPYSEDQIHGSNIVAKSITAEQVSVKDLVAFGATIADFKIEGSTETSPGRIYSGAKNSPTNTTRGIYQDTDGQFAVGDSNNFLKFYKDENGVYKLAIQASEILLGSEHKNVEQMVEDELDNINIGGRNFIRNGLMFTGYYFESRPDNT